MKINLYLDVDGVLLGRDESGRQAVIPSIHDILEYATRTFHCFWLTSHGRRRDDDVVGYLAPHCPRPVVSLLSKFQVAPWDALKTEAIDFSRPFIWIDDRPLWSEIEELRRRGCLGGWLQADTYRDLGDLTVEKIEARRRKIQSL